jgi:hypothetical protein
MLQQQFWLISGVIERLGLILSGKLP